MSVVFDPFTGQIIDTGSSGGAPSIGGPVLGADPNAILITDGATNLSDVQLADGEILIGKTGDAPLATTITGTTNQVDVTNGPNTITLSTPQDIDSTASPTFANLNLGQNVLGSLETIIDISSNVGPADTLNIGITNSDIINIGNAGAQVNIYGNTVYQNVTNLNVTDKNITVNVGGSSGSSFNAGIHVEEDVSGTPTVVGYAEVNALRDGWNFKAPLGSGIANIIPGNTGFTIDQGSHNPITIATPANGLAIDDPYNQELSIALADSSTTGALSSTDFNTFNNKQDRIISKVKAYDLVSSTLPVSAPITVDGHSIATGDAILFGALSAGNNKIYVATVSGVIITWTEDTEFVPNINDYVAVEYGNSFAQRLGVFDGTSFKFNETVRYFNGNDYFEQSALYTTNIDPSTTATVFSLNVANSENIIMDYSIVRGSNKTTGTLYITANSGAVEISDVGVDLNSSPSGVSFSGSVSMGVLTLSYISDVAGSGFLKYNIRRWSDFAGGPGGPPSYSGGGGGTASIAIEQVSTVNPTIPFSNINTIQFDNDTGFNVESVSSGVVKVSLGSTFKTWDINNGAGPAQPSLVAVGEDTVQFIAGSGIEFQTDNTLGAKTFTINSTGGGSSAQTVTLSNNVTNGDVTGFIVDPLTFDAFNSDIVIKRAVSAGIELKYINNTDYLNKILKTPEGSFLYDNGNGGSSNQILKLDSSGNIDTISTFNASVVGAFNGKVTCVIDFWAEGYGTMLVVFGNFTTYQGLGRNGVVFINSENGSDWEAGYKRFGSGIYSGSGFTNAGGAPSITSATKILSGTDYGPLSSPVYYGFLVSGEFDTFNGTPCSKLIFATMYRSGLLDPTNTYWGDLGLPSSYGSLLLKPASSGTSNFPYFSGQVNYPATSNFYAIYNNNEIFKLHNVINGANSTYVNPFSSVYNSGFGVISGIEINSNGYNAYIYGNNVRYLAPSPAESIWGILKYITTPAIGSGLLLDTTFNPFSGNTSISINVAHINTSGNQIYVGGAINTTCNNFSIIDVDGTINTSMLQPFSTGFTGTVSDFTENLFVNHGLMILNTEVYGYTSPVPVTYMTTMYGCYNNDTSLMEIKGYTNTAGTFPGVTFTIDSFGQLKYTSSNNQGGVDFTMKYRLTTL